MSSFFSSQVPSDKKGKKVNLTQVKANAQELKKIVSDQVDAQENTLKQEAITKAGLSASQAEEYVKTIKQKVQEQAVQEYLQKI